MISSLRGALAAAAVGGALSAAAQEAVPAEFQGTWVPATADCASSVRFDVTAAQMTLVNGTDRATYGDVAMAHSFFGPDYTGISVVAMPEFNSGNPPFTAYFNADEKKGVTKLDIYQEVKGPQNGQLQEIQAAAKKLAARFPLSLVPLKRCPK